MNGDERAGWRRLQRGLIDLVYPPRCLVCDFPGPAALCGECRSAILSSGPSEHETASGLDGMAAVGRYEGELREAIHALKYGRRRALAVPLGEMLARRLDETLGEWGTGVVVPVPIHWRRRFQRGFNQSELLVEEIARRVRVRVDRASLARVRHTRSQVGLSGEQRRRNLQGAFRVHAPEAIRGQTVLLVDDVATTCTTLVECAAVLRDASARAVYGLVLAGD
jgi:ComF family protein